MARVALVTFTIESINIRSLSAYLKRCGHQPYLIYFLSQPDMEDLAAFLDLLKQLNVDLLGISLVTDDFIKAKTITSAVKSHFEMPVIWGGAHPSICPDECLGPADMVCIGEGEDALMELCNTHDLNIFRTDIQNIWFKHNDHIYKNQLRPLIEDLDVLPFADYDHKDHFIINEGKKRNFKEQDLCGRCHIMTSRGCPFSCSYCYNSQRRNIYAGKGRYLRQRSVDNIIEELSRLKHNLTGIQTVNFWDDVFMAMNMDMIRYFSEQYKNKVDLPFYCLGNPNLITENKIKLLHDCGLKKMQIGIQTGSETINKQIYNRQISNQKIVDIAFLLHKYQIKASYDIIFNNPYETKDDVRQTIKLLMKFPLPLSIQGYNLIFYPGSHLYYRALSDGLITKDKINQKATIQSATDTPLKSFEHSVSSDRFYSCNFSSKHKIYLNSLITLLPYYPTILIRFLLKYRNQWLVTLLVKPFLLRKSAPRIATSLGIVARSMKKISGKIQSVIPN